MKHVLNNMSESEKNAIREQHQGGMRIDTSRFRTLLESTVGNVKTLVSEDVAPLIKEDAQQKQMFQQKAESCFDPKKYPQIAALMKAYSLSVFTLAGIAITILSSGIASGLGITGAIFGAGAAYDQVEKAINNPKSTFKKEITTFLKCTGVM